MSQVSPLTGRTLVVALSSSASTQANLAIAEVQCTTCNLWSGPLESYEAHGRKCKQWDEEQQQSKKLQDEVASTAFSNRELTAVFQNKGT
jgi:hypothetical protein